MRDKLRKLLHRRDNSVQGDQSGSASALNAIESEARSTAADKPSTTYDPRDGSPKASFDVGIEFTTAAAKTAVETSLRESLWKQAYGEFVHSEGGHLKKLELSQCDEGNADSNDGLTDFESGSNGFEICKQVLDVAKDKHNSISDKKSTGRIYDLYGKIIGSVQKFVQVGDIVSQIDPIHVGLPWAGVRFVLQMAVNDSEEYFAVLEGTERIAKLIYRYAIFENVYLGGEHSVEGKAKEELEKALKNMYKAILLYLFKAKRYYSQTATQRFLKSLVPAGGFQKLHKDINEKEAEVQDYARIVTGENDNFRFLELRKVLGAYDDHLKSDVRETILNWVSPISYLAHHRDIYDEVMEHSGEWFFEREEFVKWRNMPTSSLLWLRGDAGSGKSYLTSLVIDDLLRPHLDIQTGSAFFYCSRTSGQIERQEPKDILCSIVRQLSSPVPGLPLKPPVIAKHEQETLVAKPPAPLSLKESKKLIQKLIQDEYSSVKIVIDALDECNSKKRGDLFRFLGDLLKLPGTIVKIFVSSRNEPDIFEVFGDSDNLYIDASNNAGDIRNFVEQEVETRLLGGKAEDGLKELVKRKLCEKAQGIFRWVALQLDAICDPEFVYTAGDVTHKLDKLPETLQETYAEIFVMISKYPPDSREVTERALKWSMCTQKFLSTREFLAAVSINPNGRYVPRTKHEILRMCRSLLVIDEKLDTFRLSHLSVKEYIEDSKPLEYGELQIHTTAAETCLSILDHGHKTLKNDPEVEGFYKYAVIYWANHCYMSAQNRNEGRLRDLYHSFALAPATSISFKAWLGAVHSERHNRIYGDRKEIWQWEKLKDSLCNPPSVFFAGCAFNLPEATELISMEEPSIIKRNWYGRTGLHIACLYGSYEIARQLLQRGSDVEIEDDDGNVALCLAVENGNMDIIRMLLSSTKNFQMTKKLKSAMVRNKSNQKEVMELLLSRKEIKISEDLLMSAIVNRFDPRVVELLLDRGSEIKITQKMLEAVVSPFVHEETLKLLLSRDRDIQISEELIVTAAAHNGGALNVLLDRDGNIQITQEMMRAAAENFPSPKAMLRLLDQDQNIPITEEVIRLAFESCHDQKAPELLLSRAETTQITELTLMSAVENRFLDQNFLKLLLDRGRNIKITEEILVTVAETERCEIMQLLLSSDKGVQITEKVLQAAAKCQNGKMMEMLLDREDVRPTDQVFRTAAQFNRKEVMQLLLDQEDTQVTEGVLLTAVAYGNKERMQLLLSGENTQITEEVLSKAAVCRDKDMMELLLSRDNTQITEGVLTRAVTCRDKEMMQLLLGREETRITEGVLKAAVYGTKEMMQLLLSHEETRITEGVLKEAVTWGQSQKEMMQNMQLLLSQEETRVTEGVLMAAAANEDKEMMQLLLSQEETQITEGVLMEAADGSEILELLLDADPEAQITEEVLKRMGIESMRLVLNQNRELQITEEVVKAAVRGWEGQEFIQLWISRKVDFPITQEVLEAAALNLEAMKLLLSQDQKIYITDAILLTAASSGREDIFVLRDIIGENTDYSFFLSIAKLYNAVLDGNEGSVQRLLLDGVAPNWKDSYGRAPLCWAVIRRHSHLVSMLLESGANPLEQDKHGRTPLSLAIDNEDTTIIRIIEEHQRAQSQRLGPTVQELDE